MTDGKKSKGPAAFSGSSFALGTIDPKLKREELLIDACLERDSWVPFGADASVELLNEFAELSLGSLL